MMGRPDIVQQVRATLWAALMVLLVAILPGPAAQHAPDRMATLGVPVATLSALHGRAHLSRQDAVQVQPVAGTIPAGAVVPPAPRHWHLAAGPAVGALTRQHRSPARLARGPPRIL